MAHFRNTFFLSGSLTTITFHGCISKEDGARLDISSSSLILSSGIFLLVSKKLMERLSWIAFIISMSASFKIVLGHSHLLYISMPEDIMLSRSCKMARVLIAILRPDKRHYLLVSQ